MIENNATYRGLIADGKRDGEADSRYYERVMSGAGHIIMEARSRHRSSGAFLKMYFHILESNGKKQWKSQTVRHVRVDKST